MIMEADFEWAFELHKAAMGDYVERTWGWDEGFQRPRFADAFHRHPRQVIQVAGQDVGVVVIEERSDELYQLALHFRRRPQRGPESS